MTHKHHILLDHKTGKLTKVSSICENLYLLSCVSRYKQRPTELYYRYREGKTIQIGTFPTVFPINIRIRLSAYALTSRNSLLILEVVDDAEAGAPSALRRDGVPPTFSLHASGTFLSAEAHKHIRISAANKKVSKTGLGYPARLALPGAKRPQTYVRSQ